MKEKVTKILEKARQPRVLITSLIEFVLILLFVLAYSERKYFGITVTPRFFWSCLGIYAVCPLYRLFDHIMTTVKEIRDGIWKGRK